MLLGRWSRGARAGLECAVRMTSFREKYRISVANLREKNTLEDPGVEGRIILKWYLKKRGVYRIHHSTDKCVCLCVCVCVFFFRGGPVY